jgi:PDZ domain/Aspartyl protease
MNRRTTWLGLVLSLAALSAAPDGPGKSAKTPDAGRSYQVPYRLTDTNHFLVRVRINGKGPFNFLVDTGAPALYVATETAKKVGLEPGDDFWTPVKRLDFEGGATLRDVKARVEDPFQLVGMNALGLPGVSIDGILGFTMLARFRIELDPTKDRMTWTRLDFEPPDPPTPKRRPGEGPPAEMQAMNMLGPLAKLAAVFMGRQPEVQLLPRGFLGVELEDGPRVKHVLAGSPAAQAGVREGDQLLRVGDREVAHVRDARAAVAGVKRGDRVRLTLHRDGRPEPLTLTLTAGEGL